MCIGFVSEGIVFGSTSFLFTPSTQTWHPAARAAWVPASESSRAQQSFGFTLSRSAASRNPSGAGLPALRRESSPKTLV